MPRILQFVLLLLLVGMGIFLVGPRPDASYQVTFDPGKLPEDLDDYLRASEAQVPGVKPEAAKEIVWADPASRARTPYALVYLHGFSASKAEIEPVLQNAAKTLGANLFLTRITGHGMGSQDMANARLADWVNDTAEAVAIGSRIGDKVILVGTSTGGTLATLAASEPGLASRIAGLVLISPNYSVQGASTGMLNMPWAETLLPLVFGQERSFEPHNARQAAAWTTSYPSSAVFTMSALLRVVSNIDYGKLKVPALFVYSNRDSVVVPSKIAAAASAWGGQTEVHVIDNSGDPSNHVIAGDILSPATTAPVTGIIADWVSRQ